MTAIAPWVADRVRRYRSVASRDNVAATRLASSRLAQMSANQGNQGQGETDKRCRRPLKPNQNATRHTECYAHSGCNTQSNRVLFISSKAGSVS